MSTHGTRRDINFRKTGSDDSEAQKNEVYTEETTEQALAVPSRAVIHFLSTFKPEYPAQVVSSPSEQAGAPSATGAMWISLLHFGKL